MDGERPLVQLARSIELPAQRRHFGERVQPARDVGMVGAEHRHPDLQRALIERVGLGEVADLARQRGVVEDVGGVVRVVRAEALLDGRQARGRRDDVASK